MRRALALLPLAILLSPATGCGAGDTLELDPVANAAAKTSDAGSSRVAFELKMVGGAGENMAFGGEGVFAYDEVRGSLTMDMSSVIPGEDDGTIEMRMLGTMIYMRMPDAFAGESGLPQGKQWIGFDLAKTMDDAGLGALNPMQLQQSPSQTLRLLRASSTSVTKVGEADVRGVKTTRYTAMIDLQKSVEASADDMGLSEQQRREVRAAVEQLKKQTGMNEIPTEVFVDDDGLLRRTLMKMSFAIEGEEVSMEVLSDFYDFGVEVDVEAPPAAQVLDVTELASGAQG